MKKPNSRRERLLTTALVGAGVLTLTWWTMLAWSLWHAIGWICA